MPDENKNLPKEIATKPRVGLQERNFRIYERHLIRLMTEPQINLCYDDFPGRVRSARTFIQQLYDAKRGLELYHYKTSPILQSFPVKWIVAKEMTDDSVTITNTLLLKNQ